MQRAGLEGEMAREISACLKLAVKNVQNGC
jgi:hypothetical protein